MDPSEEIRAHKRPAAKKRSVIYPIMLLFAVLLAGSGVAFFLNYQTEEPLAIPEQIDNGKEIQQEQPIQAEEKLSEKEAGAVITPPDEVVPVILEKITTAPVPIVPAVSSQTAPVLVVPSRIVKEPHLPPVVPALSVCSQPEKQLDAFYTHLDQQPYMKAYGLAGTSQDHFTALIEKLLAHPPKVTRESDDLYTILRNTAHFFRVSGKDNVIMLQGILNAENKQLEQILADYYFLISTPECKRTKYAQNINNDELYEYGCFFLNTMGGRLYLFRRDSLSRMVVTYYAILLVDDANNQQNNRHGINLKPAVNMLLSEMETAGSNLKYYEKYIDMLYDLKEKYQ